MLHHWFYRSVGNVNDEWHKSYNPPFFVKMEAMMTPTLTDLALPPAMGAHYVAFRCRNAEETRAFYEEILGFPMAQARSIMASSARFISTTRMVTT